MFASVVDQRVRFGQKKLLVLGIQCRGARERERASIGRNPLSKNRLALLPVFRRLQLRKSSRTPSQPSPALRARYG
jgi:hypothetical protein